MFGHCSAINSISEPFVRVFRWYAFPIYDFKSPVFCHFTISQNIRNHPKPIQTEVLLWRCEGRDCSRFEGLIYQEALISAIFTLENTDLG